MKTIYNALIERLNDQVKELKWIDLDKGQLDAPVRPSVSFPCAIIGIELPQCENYTNTHQNCEGRITVQLAFDNTPDRTSANASDKVRENALKVYDIIADVYKALQGFRTEHFDSLYRISQGKVHRSNGMFQYNIVFGCDFEDLTAEQ